MKEEDLIKIKVLKKMGLNNLVKCIKDGWVNNFRDRHTDKTLLEAIAKTREYIFSQLTDKSVSRTPELKGFIDYHIEKSRIETLKKVKKISKKHIIAFQCLWT